MQKIIIVGGGASGLVSAITSKNNNNEVTIIEKNNQCGKKILITGNGKCNYFNEDFTINHYNSTNLDILNKIITPQNKEKTINFLNNLGILPKIKNNCYYPNSNQAITVRESLVNKALTKNIKIKYNEEVINIQRKQNKYLLSTNKNTYKCDILVISTGSKAYPITGSDGSGYKLLTKLNYNIIQPLPSLTSLKIKNYPFKEASGVRTDATITLYINKQPIKTTQGELQLTENSLSGIPIFQISSPAIRNLNQKVEIKINFLPQIKTNTLTWFNTRANTLKDLTIEKLLDGIFNYKLTNIFLKQTNINKNTYWPNLTLTEKQKLIEILTNQTLTVDSYYSYDKAQVCSGGIPLTEINIETFESLSDKNLYITGELLDVDGECGGFNLSFAWLSGLLSGEDINHKLTKD